MVLMATDICAMNRRMNPLSRYRARVKIRKCVCQLKREVLFVGNMRALNDDELEERVCRRELRIIICLGVDALGIYMHIESRQTLDKV